MCSWKTSTLGWVLSVTYCPITPSAVGQGKQQLTESNSHQDYIWKRSSRYGESWSAHGNFGRLFQLQAPKCITYAD